MSQNQCHTAPAKFFYHEKLKQTGDNLTGRVRRLGSYCFSTGGFADIWKGELYEKPPFKTPSTSQKVTRVAVKVMRGLVHSDANGDRVTRGLTREAIAWGKLKHPSVTPFLGYSYDFIQPHTPSLVSPFYKYGNINDYLRNQENPPFTLKLKLLTQIAAGIVYLHNHTPVVVHGDIKGPNVLIDDDGNARLSDFGLSRVLLAEPTGLTTKTMNGTYRWMAYELICPDDTDQDGTCAYTIASDVWSLGMTILEVLSGVPPFAECKRDASVIRALSSNKRPGRPSNLQSTEKDTIWNIIKSTWHQNPEERPSATDISLALDILYTSKKFGTSRNELSTSRVQEILTTNKGVSKLSFSQSGFPCKLPSHKDDDSNTYGCLRAFADVESCCKHELDFFFQ